MLYKIDRFASAHQQSSFIENCWLWTGVKLISCDDDDYDVV